MAQRQAKGSGNLTERPSGSGHWRLMFDAGVDPVTGKRRRMSVTFDAKGATAARKRANQLIVELQDQHTSTTSTCEFLFNEWMQFSRDRGRAATTLYGYQKVLGRHILPAIGELPMADLGPHHLDNLYSAMSAQGLSPTTVRQAHKIISAAFNQAVKWGWVEKNPALRATPPEMYAKRLVVPTPDEARLFIAAAIEESPILGAVVYLAAQTGARRGEIVALRWSDLQGNELSITKSVFDVGAESGVKGTKSGRERILQLDDRELDWLANWRSHCEADAAQFGVTLVDNAYLIPGRPDGSTFMRPDHISTLVRKVAKRTGLKHIHLHSMRHFVATEMMAFGFSPVDTAERLGHSDPGVTMRIYTQARVGRQKEAASLISSILNAPRPAIDKPV